MLPHKQDSYDLLKVSHKKTERHRQAEVVTYLIGHKRKSYKRFKAEVVLFFSIGMVISLLLMISLFEWKFYSPMSSEIEIAGVTTTTDEILEIPPTKQPPPPPRQVLQQPNIIEVTEEEIIEEISVDFDVEITEKEVVSYQEPEVIELEEPEVEIAEEIFTIVEEPPTPVGGFQSFYKYVAEEIKYPTTAARLGIEGKVFVEFIVNTDGSLTDITVVKGIGGGCDEEALRVIKNAPKWNVGKQRGVPVKVRMMVPIFFVLRQQ